MGNKEKNNNSDGGSSFLRSAAGFVIGTGICAGAGILAGSAEYLFESAFTPKSHDYSLDSQPQERAYAAGRQWLNTNDNRKDIYVRADDGLRLHAGFVGAEDAGSHSYAICIHGFGDSSECMGMYASVYHDRYGMNVLLPDLRGHGLSEGKYVGYGYFDRMDIISWIDWILSRDADAVIVLHGISMGAATALMTTGERIPSQVRACIADSSYTSAEEIFSYLYKKYAQGKGTSASVMIPLVRGIALVRAGYDIRKAAPVRAVARSVTPTMFIHGEEDPYIPPAMMPRLFSAANCRKAFLWVPGAGHVLSATVDPDTYWSRIAQFLRNVDGDLLK